MMRSYFSIIIITIFSSLSFAQYSGDYPLSTADVAFLGEIQGDNAGYHASIIGDVNNDGFDDILISSPLWDANPDDEDPFLRIKESGKTYLIFGKSEGWATPFNLADADASFLGEFAGNKASHDVYGIGDINADGIDDFAIGVKFYHEPAQRAGKVFIFFGKTTGWLLDTPLAASDASFLGEAETAEAAHVYPAGDLNNDGYDDILVGAGFHDETGIDAGKCYVIMGKPTAEWQNDVSLADADASYLGEMEGDWAAHRVAGAGDINGDNFDDFIIGANGRDVGNVQNRGITYIILGKADGWAKNVSLANADASILGFNEKNLNSGWSISPAGDANGDNLDDFIIGGRGKSKAMLILGQTNPYGKEVEMSTIAATTFTGEGNWDFLANDISAAGDINADGYDDFIIGAPENDNTATNAGRAYLIYGRETWPQDFPIQNADATFTGENENDWAGWTTASGGDVDNNGSNDILIAAPNHDLGGTTPDAGAVYLFLTKPLTLRIASPNGDERWFIDKTETIDWIVEPAIQNVKIEISYDAGTTWTSIVESTPNSGTFSWLVSGPVSAECLVQIQDVADGTKIDQSDANFTITDDKNITIVSPNGAEIWEAGLDQEISWTSYNTSGMVSIQLSRDNGTTWENIVESTSDNGLYNWEVTGPASDMCLISIIDSDGGPADISDAPFSITVTPSITITIPNDGQVWPLDLTHTIAWTSRHLGDLVKIELSRDGGSTWESIIDTTLNDGIYKWPAVPPESPNCLFRITELATGISDVCDRPFTIGQAASLTIISPNGGEIWEAGKETTITWEATYSDNVVAILLSWDNGATWEQIAAGIPVSQQSFTYTVQEPLSDSCLVRIIDNETGVQDDSDAVFKIQYVATVEKSNGTLPAEFSLGQNYPNPFNPVTKISFTLPENSIVELGVYNVKGELVRQLVNTSYAPGVYEITWNGQDSKNQQVTSGMYFYKISANNYQQVRRMMLLK